MGQPSQSASSTPPAAAAGDPSAAPARPRWARPRTVLTAAVGAYLLVVTLAAATHIIGLHNEGLWWRSHRDLFETSLRLIGHSETEAVRTLGKPDLVIHRTAIESGAVTYPVSGYADPGRPVRHHVLVYFRGHAISYIYIGPAGSIEDAFVGPS
jgi:hypothetical protein